MVCIAGCGEAYHLPGVNTPYREDGNFHLYISNQSFAEDPIDIRVWIDGELTVQQYFFVGSQHNWQHYRLWLKPNSTHTIRVVSQRGKAELEQHFEMTDERFAVVDYWYDPDEPATDDNPKRRFSFNIEDQSPMFQ